MPLTDYPVRIDEHNGIMHAFCPTCSRMYAVEEPSGETDPTTRLPLMRELDLPRVCVRCGGPMDEGKAVAYGERFAEAANKGMRRPPADKQIKEGQEITK